MTIDAALLSGLATGLWLRIAWRDIATRQVSDREALAVGLVGLLFSIHHHHPFGALVSGVLLFLLGVWLWRRGLMGGGDVRLLAAAGAAVTPTAIPALILDTALAGGILSLGYLAAMKMCAWPPRRRIAGATGLARVVLVERWRLHRGCPLPYACAIATGAIILLW